MTSDKYQLWEILEAVGERMVTTKDGDVMRSRPMVPLIDKDARTIRFMTDDESAKVFELNTDTDIALSFADTDKMLFASVSGHGRVSSDQGQISEMWGPYAEVFFGSGPENADVAIVTIDPVQAEFWNNRTGKVAMAFEMARAYFSEDGPNLGANAKLESVK